MIKSKILSDEPTCNSCGLFRKGPRRMDVFKGRCVLLNLTVTRNTRIK